MDNTPSIKLLTMSDLTNDASLITEHIIQDMIAANSVSLLSGGVKVGKTALALNLAYSVATGSNFLGHKTTQCDVLYISLDNTSTLIKDRIHRMNLTDNGHIQFYFEKPLVLGNDPIMLGEQTTLAQLLTMAMLLRPNTRLVIIDLLDNIRSVNVLNEYSNVKIAEDINFLISLAERYGVAFLCVNHDTKRGTGDGYASTKGGVELVGTINGSYLHLMRNGIAETETKLELGGRNIPEDVIYLNYDPQTLTHTVTEKVDLEIPYELGVVRNYILRKHGFTGSLANLCAEARIGCSTVKLGKMLSKYKDILLEDSIHFHQEPGHKHGRIYNFVVDDLQDVPDAGDR